MCCWREEQSIRPPWQHASLGQREQPDMSEELGTEVPLDREQGHENHAWLVLSWCADLLPEWWGWHRQGGVGRV